MSRHLILSNATIKAIKNNDPRRRLSDGDGLYLRLFVNGGSHAWRFDYTFDGRRNTLSLGTYPTTTLSAARQKAEKARRVVDRGVDPSQLRKAARAKVVERREAATRAEAGLPPVDSFEAVAREWYEKNAPNWAATHSEKIIRRLERDVFPWIGKKPVASIRPADLLELLRRVESRGAIETTHRVQQNCGQVFRYALATARAESDPSRDLRGALTPWRPEHYATLTDPREVGRLLRDIESYEGSFATKCAMNLAPMLFVRPGELRRAEWSEIDLDNAEWRIPAAKMKGRILHIVPLAKQAVRILAELKPLTDRPRLGLSGRAHEWRADERQHDQRCAASPGLRPHDTHGTRFSGNGFDHAPRARLASDVIERQLSHAERNSVKAAYNHAEHLPARRKMMQAWADYLDKLRKGADVVPMRKV